MVLMEVDGALFLLKEKIEHSLRISQDKLKRLKIMADWREI